MKISNMGCSYAVIRGAKEDSAALGAEVPPGA
jgi:hypothetical protein